MADSIISDLPEDTAPTQSDIVPFTDVSGTPTTEKTTCSNLTKALNVAALPSATVATGDLVMVSDVDDSNTVKQVTAQSIADLAGVSGAITAGTIFLPAEAFVIPSSGGATQQQVSGSNYDYIQIAFADAATESADAKIVMPEDWDAGTLTATVIWSTNTAVDTETASWQLEGDRVEAGAVVDGALTTMASVDSDADGVADAWVYEDFGTITKPTDLAAGDVLFLRLSRLGSGGNDDLTDDADFHGLRIEYTRATA